MKSRNLLIWGVILGCVICSTSFAQKSTKTKNTAPAKDTTVVKKDAAAAPVTAPAETPVAGGGYKIGVVNRKTVVNDYKKVKNEYAKLKAEMEKRQVGIDDLSKEIEKDKAAFKKDTDDGKLSPTERTDREAAIQNKFSNYKNELTKNQNDIDAMESKLMKTVLSEINDTIKTFAEKGQYHIILDGSTQAGAIYYAKPVDISRQIVDLLNANYTNKK